jgi:hypothetical protein
LKRWMLPVYYSERKFQAEVIVLVATSTVRREEPNSKNGNAPLFFVG